MQPSGVAQPTRDEGVSAGGIARDQRGRFAAIEAAFQRAANIRPDQLCESDYMFAGQSVRIRIAGRNLADQFCRPFAHLETNEQPLPIAHLTIDLWDEEKTGISCPLDLSGDGLGIAARIGDRPLAISADGRFVCQRFRQSETWLDRQTRHVVGRAASAQELSLYERGKPLLPLLNVWYHDQDMQLIHAGLVSRNGLGVLFPGGGGAGKSTSALACLTAGFDYLGDDYIGLQVLGDLSFVGHTLYNSTWLELDHMARFPLLPPYAIRGNNPSEDKALVLLSQVYPERLVPAAPIRVLALPRIVASNETRSRPASKAEALLALVPTSLFALHPRPGSRGFQRLAQLVELVPSYWLELGRDLSQIPRRVDELLAEVTG
jgi:hypothetical protein